jgi:ABC-type transport system involved in multi-copper enzyme maturation permease subunit
VELLKIRSKPVTWMTLALLFAGPIGFELFLASTSPSDAVFPDPTVLASDILLIVVLMVIVVAVMALGNDYELGTVRAFLSRGVARYQFIVSKVLATALLALAGGLAYVAGALAATSIAHVRLSGVPLAEAAGEGLVWRALGAVGVIGLTGFVFAGVVMLALVVGRTSWMGMLAGLGVFMADFYFGTLSAVDSGTYRYAVTYHALSLLARCLNSESAGMRVPGTLAGYSLAQPGRALTVILLYGCGLTLLAILVFRQQDLVAKS